MSKLTTSLPRSTLPAVKELLYYTALGEKDSLYFSGQSSILAAFVPHRQIVPPICRPLWVIYLAHYSTLCQTLVWQVSPPKWEVVIPVTLPSLHYTYSYNGLSPVRETPGVPLLVRDLSACSRFLPVGQHSSGAFSEASSDWQHPLGLTAVSTVIGSSGCPLPPPLLWEPT
jgi:hypothetical protein